MMGAMEGHLDFTEALLAAGARPELKDGEGMTAAHWALCMEHRDVGMALLKAGGEAAWLIEDDNGSTPKELLENLDLLYPQVLKCGLYPPNLIVVLLSNMILSKLRPTCRRRKSQMTPLRCSRIRKIRFLMISPAVMTKLRQLTRGPR